MYAGRHEERDTAASAPLPADPDRSMKLSKDDPRYQPTKAELEEDMRVDASFDELVDAMFGRRPRRVIH